MSTNYEQQANDFLTKTGTKVDISFSHAGKHFDDDQEVRDIYKITIARGNRKFFFNFGNSLNKSGFYYTKGKQKINIDRKYLEEKNLVSIIKRTDCDFLNNGKSDVIHKPVEPSNYDILACLTKSDPGSFENFCSEFGYNPDSVKANKIYSAVISEWMNVCALFTDTEINELSEIQ